MGGQAGQEGGMSCAAILERDIGVACSFGILWSDPWCYKICASWLFSVYFIRRGVNLLKITRIEISLTRIYLLVTWCQ